MNICESLTVTAEKQPDQIALIFGQQSIRYQELNQLSIVAAKHLEALGLKPGDRVALMLPNSPAFPIWYYAILRIGAIAVSINTRLAPSEVAYVINDCDAKGIIASDSILDSIPPNEASDRTVKLSVDNLTGHIAGHTTGQTGQTVEAIPATHQESWCDCQPDDPALILYTSGTTGFPKGATLSHANVRSNVLEFNRLCNMRAEDRVLVAVPLFHCFGQNALLNSILNVGGTMILQQKFDLNESKRLIADHQVTQLYGVPMMFGLMLESCSTEDLASVEYCFSAAATLPTQTSAAWQQKFGMPIHEGYGLTETSPFASYNHHEAFVPGSIGTPINDVEIKVVHPETGSVCRPHELGEIVIKGPNVMLGYWNRPEETAQAIRDGWFHSGDIGRMDEQGYLYIIDRVKDMIAIGGLKVFPAEVERVLLDHPDVAQAAVVGIPDAIFGEQVVAYLVLNGDRDPNTLPSIEAHARSHLGTYKVPRQLIVIDALPRNPSGKILKTELRKMSAERTATQACDADGHSLTSSNPFKPATLRGNMASAYASEKLRVATEFLQNHIAESLDLGEIPAPEDSFIEAGLDSLAIVDLSAQLQFEIGPEPTLPPTLLFDHPRLCDLAAFLVTTISSPDDQDQAPSGNRRSVATPNQQKSLRDEIEEMTEEEALEQLMKELG